MRHFLVVAGLTAACVSCGERGLPPSRSSHAHDTPAAGAGATTAPVATVDPMPPARPAFVPAHGKLPVAEARRYMLALVNRDRATQKLPPVALDEGAATRSADRHARDMATNGFLGHWGTDGSVPEQRLTESGGADAVLENALCVADENKRDLVSEPMLEATELERAEAMFFNETPPNDGHRRNILKATHTHVGIGFSLARSLTGERIFPCMAQEFIDVVGTYDSLPPTMKAGKKLHVAGTLAADVEMGAVGVAKLVSPNAISASEANKRRSYTLPKADVMYWPKGYVTPLAVQVDGSHFAVDVPMRTPGFYEISVWGRRPGEEHFTTVGLRTLRVD